MPPNRRPSSQIDPQRADQDLSNHARRSALLHQGENLTTAAPRQNNQTGRNRSDQALNQVSDAVDNTVDGSSSSSEQHHSTSESLFDGSNVPSSSSPLVNSATTITSTTTRNDPAGDPPLNRSSTAGSLPSSPSEADVICPICREADPIHGPMIKLHAMHEFHASCVAGHLKTHWTRFDPLEESPILTDDIPTGLGQEVVNSLVGGTRRFLQCPSCRGGVFAPNLVYETSQGERRLLIPRADFVQEIENHLNEAIDTGGTRSFGNILSTVASLVEVFNSIYHHCDLESETIEHASWDGQLLDGSQPFYPLNMNRLTESIRAGRSQDSMAQIRRFLSNNSFISSHGPHRWLEQWQMSSRIYPDVAMIDLTGTDAASRSPTPERLPPGIPAQGRQPELPLTGTRSGRRQHDGSTFRIGRRGVRPAFFVECDGETYEVLWYQTFRTRKDRERGGRFILAKAREGREDCLTTRPLSRFSSNIRAQFQIFCLQNNREPEFFTGTIRGQQDQQSLWRQVDFLERHPLEDWLIVATFHVPGAPTKRTKTAYVILHFRSEASTQNNTIFDAWKFSTSELRKAYDFRGDKLVDEKLAAFRTEHGL